LTVLFGWALSLLSQPYVEPVNHRTDLVLADGWRFMRRDLCGAQDVGFDDSAWPQVRLPHTWNNLDGQDGGNDYYRGIGWIESI
jgi:beta-galactosidase